jgi:hypothetical protein
MHAATTTVMDGRLHDRYSHDGASRHDSAPVQTNCKLRKL